MQKTYLCRELLSIHIDGVNILACNTQKMESYYFIYFLACNTKKWKVTTLSILRLQIFSLIFLIPSRFINNNLSYVHLFKSSVFQIFIISFLK